MTAAGVNRYGLCAACQLRRRAEKKSATIGRAGKPGAAFGAYTFYMPTPVSRRWLFVLALLSLSARAFAEAPRFDSPARAWGIARFAHTEAAWPATERAGVNLYAGEEEFDGDAHLESVTGTPLAPRAGVTSLGIAWRHMLAAQDEVRVSARYDEISDARTSNYFAAIGWRGAYADAGRAHVVGSVYIGEEGADRGAERGFGRRYFGLSADGSYALFKDHSPFLSLRLQRSDYDDAAPYAAGMGGGELWGAHVELSQFAAGWDWQVYPRWHVRAQAEYALNKSSLSLYEYDANRLFFSTRFDFR